jgi:hypothetical protein
MHPCYLYLILYTRLEAASTTSDQRNLIKVGQVQPRKIERRHFQPVKPCH